MIKAVVFDLGKVLLDFDYGIVAKRLAEHGKMSIGEIRSWISASPLLFRYETGLMSSNEFYDEICRHTGYTGELEDFSTCFGDIFTPIEPMIALQRKLRARGYATHVFSNTNELAIRHIRETYPFFSDFDRYILSYEHRAMKPDRSLYEVVEKQTGQRGQQILYIDDRPENVEAGQGRGWEVILQQTPEKTAAAVTALGLLS